MGVYLPLITTNCIVLGVAILNIQEKYNILETAASAFSAALGFSLALVLMASVREKLEIAEIHESLKGFPLTLIAAGLMSIAFAGFSGLM
jgi:electron transport complex protein RnfA